ncbi:hypothetical protein Ahy_A08g040847 [Arachis hypogaea]|uniref:Uncharacterized protein n=1 Tax=Arachis hypogaea TaxID=3818 RepID=A0A445C0S4_ARAHY|nr:hypothetical protein Ahy_A08g040847 [Arachis hypogaea]
MAPPLSSASERELEGERKRDGGEKKGRIFRLLKGAVLFGFMAFGVIYLLSTILLICFNDFSEIQWVHEDRITLFTADGLVQIGGSITPRHVSSSDVVPKTIGKDRMLLK